MDRLVGTDASTGTSAEASNGPQGEAQKSNDWLTPNMPEDSIQAAFSGRWSWPVGQSSVNGLSQHEGDFKGEV